MIQYALRCGSGHRFDAWFKSADAFDRQADQGLLSCPQCGSSEIEKALMAPAVAKTLDPSPVGPVTERARMVAMMRALKSKIEAEADYVGAEFAEEARRIHYGEAEERGIYGEASRDEVVELIDEGIEIMPLPILPDDQN
jgi:hypothetical protein